MRIGQVARASGVGVETVRFYEQKGLLPRPPRPADGGFRDYPVETVERIGFIRQAQQLGFSLSEIDALMALGIEDGPHCVDVRRRAERKRAEVEERIANLARIRDALDELIAACPGRGPARDCSIIAAINSGALQLAPLTRENGDD